MASRASDWLPADSSSAQTGLFYCSKNNRLQLLSQRSGGPPQETYAIASVLVNTSPAARDQFGNYARWDSSSGHVMAGGSGPGEVPTYVPTELPVTDLIMGYDGIIYIADNQKLVLIDPLNRWPNFTLAVSDFKFWRLAALPEGGVLALDQSSSQLAKVTGQPLPTGPIDQPNPGVMRSCQQNPTPPRITARFPLPGSEVFIALVPMDPGGFMLLSWATNDATNQKVFLRTFAESEGLGSPLQLDGVNFPYTIAWLGDGKVAALATGTNEALIFNINDAGGILLPAGETYILADKNLGPFAHGFDLPPYYSNGPDLLPLLPLSLNSFTQVGSSDPANPLIFDSGSSQTVWHRLFAEAVIPQRCGVLLWLAAVDNQANFASTETEWHPHVFGSIDAPTLAQLPSDTPIGAWQSCANEIPFSTPLLGEDPVAGRQGLFMALVQRANKVTRDLRGRYLGIRVRLNGDARTTPEIAALRVYASRFSYVEHYLPEIYREHKFPPEADLDGASTRCDFLERFVGLFESQFTRIEDRVASAYLLTRPESSPDDSLDWLGSWVGIEPNNYPPDRRRARLGALPQLYKKRGTGPGVKQALDVATDGMCSRGAIIVIEDFRLRHIFATILGADLSIKNDPLLPGYSGSSNSIVGDSLFLGDPRVQAELQALYASDLNLSRSAEAVQAFYDALAHRMTVFIHDQVESVNIKLVQAIVESEKPAHVMAAVRRASQPFMIGLASLLGVNTYLAPEPPRRPARIDISQIGRYDVITGLATLDPRLENGETFLKYELPVARITGPSTVSQGQSIVLDGTASTAPPGLTVDSYTWSLLSQ
jgi:phage tail-like protein